PGGEGPIRRDQMFPPLQHRLLKMEPDAPGRKSHVDADFAVRIGRTAGNYNVVMLDRFEGQAGAPVAYLRIPLIMPISARRSLEEGQFSPRTAAQAGRFGVDSTHGDALRQKRSGKHARDASSAKLHQRVKLALCSPRRRRKAQEIEKRASLPFDLGEADLP